MQQISFDGRFPVPSVINIGSQCAQSDVENLFFVLPTWVKGNATLNVSFTARQGLLLPIVNGAVSLTCSMTGQQGKGRGIVQIIQAGQTVWQSDYITFNVDWTGASPSVTPQESYFQKLVAEVQQNAENAANSATQAASSASAAQVSANQATQAIENFNASSETLKEEIVQAVYDMIGYAEVKEY